MRKTTLIAFLGLAFVFQGCTDDSPGLIVQGVVPWDKDCDYTDSGDKFWYEGVYDAYCAGNFSVALLVNSFTMSLADPIRPRAEPSVIQIDTAEVQLQDLEGRLIVAPFSIPVEGFVPPGTASDPGQGIVVVEAIPSFYAEKLNDERYIGRKIIASFRLYGSTSGGTDVEVSEYTFPIRICSGCLTIFFSKCPPDKDERDDAFEELEDCQNGSGTNGAACFCADMGGDECVYCPPI